MNEIKANRITNDNTIEQNHMHYGLLMNEFIDIDPNFGSFFVYFVKDFKPCNGAEYWPKYMQKKLLLDYVHMYDIIQNVSHEEVKNNYNNYRKNEYNGLNKFLLSFFGINILVVWIYALSHIFG